MEKSAFEAPPHAPLRNDPEQLTEFCRSLRPPRAKNYATLASCLLVQPELLESIVLREYVTRDRVVPYQCVQELAARFQVSREAMGVVLQMDDFIPEKRPIQLQSAELDPTS